MLAFPGRLAETRKLIGDAETYLRIEELRARRPLLETEASRPDLWDDADAAKRVTGELSTVIDDIEMYERLEAQLEDAETLHELAREVDDASQEPEIEGALVRSEAHTSELQSLMRISSAVLCLKITTKH